jgi:hypothetical protein
MPAPLKSVHSLESYLGTDSTDTGILVIIHARPKAGKTTLAATASQFYTPGKPCDLEDMLFLVMDNDGLGALESKGIKVPSINVLKMWADMGFTRGTRALLDGLPALLDKRGTNILCVDSLSSLDIEANAQYYDRAPEGVDHWTSFRQVLGEHRIFHSNIRRLGVDVIYNCHSKVVGEAETEVAKTKDRALRLAAGGNIVPALTGQALSIYQRDQSFQGAIMVKKAVNGAGLSRILCTVEQSGFEAGSRYEHLFETLIPCDMRAVFARIHDSRKKKESNQ